MRLEHIKFIIIIIWCGSLIVRVQYALTVKTTPTCRDRAKIE